MSMPLPAPDDPEPFDGTIFRRKRKAMFNDAVGVGRRSCAHIIARKRRTVRLGGCGARFDRNSGASWRAYVSWVLREQPLRSRSRFLTKRFRRVPKKISALADGPRQRERASIGQVERLIRADVDAGRIHRLTVCERPAQIDVAIAVPPQFDFNPSLVAGHTPSALSNIQSRAGSGCQ